MEILTDYVNPQSIATEANPTYIKTSHKRMMPCPTDSPNATTPGPPPVWDSVYAFMLRDELVSASSTTLCKSMKREGYEDRFQTTSMRHGLQLVSRQNAVRIS